MPDEAAVWIAHLGLQVGPDGVYSAEFHRAAVPGGGRTLLRARYYLLTSRAPRTTMIRGPADALYFHHAGGQLRVHSRAPTGERRAAPLGPPDAYQVAVAGGSWRTVELVAGEWALIGAAELPGDAEYEAGPDILVHGCAAGDRDQAGASASAGDAEHEAGSDMLVHEGVVRKAGDPGRMFASAGGVSTRELRDETSALGAVTGERLIAGLGLRAHGEGGHFVECWRALETLETVRGPRSLGSTIYYLLGAQAAIGYFHRNTFDITHLLHSGGPIVYSLISPDGEWRGVVLGRDPAAGQVLSFTCPGGYFKSSHLAPGVEHGLISEIVAPGFDYADHTMADAALFEGLYPQHRTRWAAYVR